MARIARTALPRPVRQLFDYRVPDGMEVMPGQRVRVPFGQQVLTGLVTELDPADPARQTLKPIRDPLEAWPVLPLHTLELLLWAARHYQHPPGECLFAALPPALRKGASATLPGVEYWYPQPGAAPEQLPGQARRQRELLELLLGQPGQSRAALRQAGFEAPQLRALAERGLIAPSQKAPEQPPSTSSACAEPAPLNDAQAQVLRALDTSSSGYSPHLLFGVTGSGKTEVYIHYLLERLFGDPAQGSAQALVLVPEINLTPQTMARFERHFGERIAVWHSALNATERLRTWSRVRRGEPLILIGTRSAVLLPFPELRTIIVDEEHDGSYKQHEGFRYSARDLAIYRAWQNHCPIILGSATPSLESLHNARQGRYHLHELTQRAGRAGMPEMNLVDVRSRPLQGGLSSPLIEAVGRTIEAGEQALLFINRRGFSPVVMCFDCGTPIDCPQCDAKLTYHRHDNCLRCHHCGHQQALPRGCPECASDNLNPVGQGTERTETVLSEHFPDTPVIRIDRDTTRRRGQLDDMLEQIRTGRPCILVGTQMLAKGHDFPAVTLAGILDADGGLFSSDFRGPEQLAQLIIQVGGRAGRGDRAGQVLIQTCQSGHPLLQSICHGEYLGVAWKLLEERDQAGLPPTSFMTAFRVDAPSMEESLNLLDDLARRATTAAPEATVMGPFPAIIARKANRYRAQLLLQHSKRPPLQRLSNRLCRHLEQNPPGRQIRWHIDVDPLSID